MDLKLTGVPSPFHESLFYYCQGDPDRLRKTRKGNGKQLCGPSLVDNIFKLANAFKVFPKSKLLSVMWLYDGLDGDSNGSPNFISVVDLLA